MTYAGREDWERPLKYPRLTGKGSAVHKGHTLIVYPDDVFCKQCNRYLSAKEECEEKLK